MLVFNAGLESNLAEWYEKERFKRHDGDRSIRISSFDFVIFLVVV